MNILATGGTGLLGPNILKELAKEEREGKPRHHITILVRPESLERAEKLYAHHPNVYCLPGDLTHPDLFQDSDICKRLQDQVEVVIHMAASYDLKANYSDCFLHNVLGTQNVLYFAGLCRKLKHFHYTSTIAVAGDHSGEMAEDAIDYGQSFSNHYAKTKYDAEILVRHWKTDVQKSIYRLGILVGESEKGEFTKVDGPYYFLKSLGKAQSKKILVNALKYLPMPFDKKAILPFIPVDQAAKLMLLALGQSLKARADRPPLRCYHVIDPKPPLVGQFIQDAFDAFGFSVTIVPLPDTRVNDLLMDKIGIPRELLDYLYSQAQFSLKNQKEDFPDFVPVSYPDYHKALFKFAEAKFKTPVAKAVRKTSKRKA